tara:strand:+ start:449 stop:1018 length:570 start_codon:yes stop_codon:yes gene_type:complete
LLSVKFIRILLIVSLFVNFSVLKADAKKNIIENINKTDSIKFDFIQITNDKEEKGVCYLKRPHYLKCEYKDKNQKQLIVNRNNLVIYHKRYEKIYNYPLSKSYFSEILNKEKFSKMIAKGILKKKDKIFLVNCLLKEKGQIDFYFNSEDFSLYGWDLISLNDNKINFKILNSVKNYEIKKTLFDIPKIN